MTLKKIETIPFKNLIHNTYIYNYIYDEVSGLELLDGMKYSTLKMIYENALFL